MQERSGKWCVIIHARETDGQIMQVEPGSFKTLSDLVANETKGKGRVESMGTASG